MDNLGIVIFAVVVGGIVYYQLKKKSDIQLNEEVVDTELLMDDVISFFKMQKLDQKKHVPFMANGDCTEFRKLFHAPYPKAKEGYSSLLIGVYDEQTQEIIVCKLIHAKSLDKRILETLGNENLVVLN